MAAQLVTRDSGSEVWDSRTVQIDISEYNEELLEGRNIVISQHCYGCTAGAGSSCQGSVA